MKNKVKSKFLNKKIGIWLILVIIIGLILCLIVNKNNFIEDIVRKIKGEETSKEELFSYIMYDNQDENNIKVLVKVASEDGIEYVETPDDRKILSNGNKQVTLDYEVKKDENYTFKIKEKNKEPISKNLIVNDKYIHDKIINFSNTTEGTGVTTIQINKYIDFDDFITYYKFGENGEWEQCEEKILKYDYIDFYQKNLLNDDGTITLDIKVVNNKISNQIILDSEKYKVGAQNGILQVLQEAELQDNEYFETIINRQTYTMHTYVFDGDQEWNENKIFGDANDIGTANSYAKNMVVVKVNGNLTIGENVNITTFNSSFGGPKGMLLYVTGDIINKGTISMTARGAKAKGEDVYLWKNSDKSYEYVPAIGANGGQSKSLTYNGSLRYFNKRQ